MNFVDTHAHLMGKEFAEDLDAVLSRAKKAQVKQIMIITLSAKEAQQALAFLDAHPNEGVSVATGIFMDEAATYTENDWNRLEQIARDPRISCIGEIGLDYYWEKEPTIHKSQQDLFIRQIELAQRLRKPILVHSREAMQDTYNIMKAHRTHGLLHCFSGSKEMAIEFTKLGYYIALGGALTFKNSRHSQEVAKEIDARYLLSETDCPYMAPEPVRGTRNEPANIPYIVSKMAMLRGITLKDMAAQIQANWTRFLEQK